MDNTEKAVQGWDHVAPLYQEKFMDLDLYNDTYDQFRDLLKPDQPLVFEIGCGPGNITRYLATYKPDAAITAIDISPAMISLAQTNVPSAHFSVMDCREIGQLPGKYDGIICGFCMPYLSGEECTTLLSDCSSLLVPGGVLYFSVIEGDPAHSGYQTSSDGKNRQYMYYHSTEMLTEVLARSGFEIKALVRKNYSDAKGDSVHLIFIAEKKGDAALQ